MLRIWRKYVKSVNLTIKVSVFKPIDFKLKSGDFVRFYRVIYGCFMEGCLRYIFVRFCVLLEKFITFASEACMKFFAHEKSLKEFIREAYFVN